MLRVYGKSVASTTMESALRASIGDSIVLRPAAKSSNFTRNRESFTCHRWRYCTRRHFTCRTRRLPAVRRFNWPTYVDAPGVGYRKEDNALTFYQVSPLLSTECTDASVASQSSVTLARAVEFVQMTSAGEPCYLPRVNSGTTPKKVNRKKQLERWTVSVAPVIKKRVDRKARSARRRFDR